jgi:hypothetical protein
LHKGLCAVITAIEARAGLLDAAETAAVSPAEIEAIRNERRSRHSVNTTTAAPAETSEAAPRSSGGDDP